MFYSYNNFVDGQTIGHLTGEFVDRQTIVQDRQHAYMKWREEKRLGV
jgi:hypothetical protein